MFKAKTQPKERFENWVLQHQSMVFSIALRILNDPATAEDIAQEVFMKLYASPEVASDEHAISWLRRATVHRSIDHLRRQRSHPGEDLPQEPACFDTQPDPVFASVRGRLLSRLSPSARAVVTLRYQEDLDPADIADILTMPLATVKSHLKRSLEFFRLNLQPTSVEPKR